ncbi:peptide chain release factor N(5)-glutamine methyltransferase [Chryseolinea soli]|uniref:Release factor glutamine methyltransferase n=1 Tax=Chryseolinea soli TaxID=2321403 RepID=A0A385SJL8_9BACT|nr:peptide chain release factor N(5)-glutamine methyltransferase [Chryseolinea soli]AYB31144.1 peptide chain release factor N(5)-glutamine methyltransferase [Chryseolinea soli]
MKNSKALFRYFVSRIRSEDADEVNAMAYIVLEHLFSISRTDVLAEKPVTVSPEAEEEMNVILNRLNTGEPLQYVLGEAEFYGRRFRVRPGVLIPRPETEELVREVVESGARSQEPGARSQHSVVRSQGSVVGGGAVRVLDIGTGTGCIPVTLFLELVGAEVFAVDVSDVAVAVARENASLWNAKVEIVQLDILKEALPWEGLDVIVSNPPYIPWSERVDMRRNVTDFEPALALFVPEDDPLIFYKAIAKQASRALRRSGLLAVEINERFGEGVAEVFQNAGFKEVVIIKDIFGKERIVKGVLG